LHSLNYVPALTDEKRTRSDLIYQFLRGLLKGVDCEQTCPRREGHAVLLYAKMPPELLVVGP